jgi:hypothetical protein
LPFLVSSFTWGFWDLALFCFLTGGFCAHMFLLIRSFSQARKLNTQLRVEGARRGPSPSDSTTLVLEDSEKESPRASNVCAGHSCLLLLVMTTYDLPRRANRSGRTKKGAAHMQSPCQGAGVTSAPRLHWQRETPRCVGRHLDQELILQKMGETCWVWLQDSSNGGLTAARKHKGLR